MNKIILLNFLLYTEVVNWKEWICIFTIITSFVINKINVHK